MNDQQKKYISLNNVRLTKAVLLNTNERKYAHEISQACPGKSVVRLTDRLDMTIAVDWDVKPQTKHH